MFATKWHEHAVLGSCTKCAHNRYLLLVIHVRERAGDSRHRCLSEVLLKNTLGSMPGSSVRHFMTKHCGQRRIAVGNRKDSRINNYLPARQTKRVHMIALHKRDAPVEILSSRACCRGETLHHTLDPLEVRSGINSLRLGKDLLVALQPERRLLLDRQSDMALAACLRIHKFF